MDGSRYSLQCPALWHDESNLHVQLSVFNSLIYPTTLPSRISWESDALQRLHFLSQTEPMLLTRNSQPQCQPQAQQPPQINHDTLNFLYNSEVPQYEVPVDVADDNFLVL